MLNIFRMFTLLCAVAVVSGVIVMKIAMYQGGESITTPDISGKRIIPALETLEKAGLYLKVVRLDFSPSITKDRIISQNPVRGEKTKKGRDVRVIVSRGSKETLAPTLTGASLNMAESILTRNGIKTRKKVYMHADTPANTILAQKPLAQTTMSRGDAMTLLVSLGKAPEYIMAPDFIDQPISYAMERLKSINLKISRVTYKPSPFKERGYVLSQDPPFGTKVKKGSFISLLVSEGVAEGADDPATFTFLYYTIPDMPSAVKVSIFQENLDGEDEVYNRVHRPGDTLSLLVRIKGHTTVKIFINNELAEARRY